MMQFFREAWEGIEDRASRQPMGFFQPTIGDQNPSVLVVSAFRAPEEAVTQFDRLMSNSRFAAAYSKAQTPEPAFVRADVSLLRAFEGMPTLTPPPAASGGAPRIFELRTYESNSMLSLRKKIEMFNAGEIGVFKRLGMNPVFFGEGIFGRNLPSLTYMLAFQNLAERERLWGEFVRDAEFTKLRTQPGYSDAEIVSSISNSILSPLSFSPIR